MGSAVKSKGDIRNRLRQHKDQLHSLGVEKLGLFGSFARDEQKPESDIDILVRFRPGEKNFDKFMELSFLLEDVLQRRVELVTTEGLSPYLGPRILKEVQDVAFDS
jgi:uncharacterized protein